MKNFIFNNYHKKQKKKLHKYLAILNPLFLENYQKKLKKLIFKLFLII